MTPIRLVIHGAAGRMGRRLVALGSTDPELRIVAALECDGHPELGRDAGSLAGISPLGVPLTVTLDTDADVLVDFSLPAGAEAAIALCAARRLPLVLATTGLEQAQKNQLRAAAEQIPVVWSPSMSLAVNLSMQLATLAAGALKHVPGGADVEIIERHHRFKKDSPSGTALRFGELIAGQMGQTRAAHGREGVPGERPHDEIGYHAVRAGDNPGEHTILFGLLGESIELTVRAGSRDCYATGALAAARFIARKTPGLYTMYDVLGL